MRPMKVSCVALDVDVGSWSHGGDYGRPQLDRDIALETLVDAQLRLDEARQETRRARSFMEKQGSHPIPPSRKGWPCRRTRQRSAP
jgi:hypothetical protein